MTDEDAARLGWLTPRHDFRWRVVPGLTGLAQMLGPPSATGSLSLDRYYVSRGPHHPSHQFLHRRRNK